MALIVGGSTVATGATVTFNGNAVSKIVYNGVEVWPGIVEVTGVTLSSSTLSIYAGHTSTLTATVTPSNADDTSLTWTSSNTSIATVSSSGVVTAKKAGSCTITATASNGVSASCSVTVKAVTVTGISCNIASCSVNVGGTYTRHNCTIYYSDGTSNTSAYNIASWWSSDDDVATVTGSTVTGVSAGTCTGYCSYGRYTDSFSITVKAVSATSVTLSSSSLSLEVGDTGSLTATVKPTNTTDPTVSWSSSDSSVATVDSDGNVTAVGEGSCTITASCGSKSATCSVTVTNPMTGLSVSPSSDSVDVGDTTGLTATATYKDGSTVDVTSSASWSSSSSSVASVSSGTVTGVGEGSATITASYGGYSDSCSVTVENPLVSLSLSSNSETITKGDSVSLTATATYKDGSTADVTSSATWASSSSSIASVSSGTVTGTGVGSATIVCGYGDCSATCSVTVENPVTKLSISSSPVYVNVGGTADISLTATYADGTTEDVAALASWSSANTSYVTVDGGTVTGIKASSSGVTVTAIYGGKSASCAVAILNPMTGLTVSPSSDSVTVGDTTSLTATATYSDGSTEDVTSSATWSTSSSTYATVSKGTVTGVKAGSATITATYGGFSDTCDVTVNKAQTTVKYQFTNGSSYSCTVSVNGSNGSSYSVDPNGYVSDMVEWTLPASVDVIVSSNDEVDITSPIDVAIDIGGSTEAYTIADMGKDAEASGTLTDDYPSISVDISSK